jgi:hypothetical protein
MLSYLLAFITFVCSHTECNPSIPGFSQNNLIYWVQQYADSTQDQARKLLQDNAPPQ